MKSVLSHLPLALLFVSVFVVAEQPASVGETGSAGLVQLERIAERLEFPGEAVEVVWLGEGSGRSLALYQAAGRTPVNGAVVILLPPNESFAGSGYSTETRRLLAAGGWAVLVIHGEILGKQDLSAFEPQRTVAALDQGIAHLNSNGYSRIVIAAFGAVAEAVWPKLQSGATQAIGFIGIGRWSVAEFSPPMPVFDIVNSRDQRALHHSKKRLATTHLRAQHGMELFAFAGIAHDYRGDAAMVGGRMRGWLNRQFAQR